MISREWLRDSFIPLTATYRLLRYPKTEIQTWRDLARTRMRVRRVFPKQSTRHRGVVLGFVGTGSIYETKLLMTFLGTLQSYGYSAVAVLQSRNPFQIPLYVRAFNIPRTVFLDDWHPAGDSVAEVEAINAKIKAQAKSVTDLKQVHVEGSDVGMHILSSLCREFYVGSVDLNRPSIRRRFEELALEVSIGLVRAGTLLDELQPDYLLCVEAKGSGAGPFTDRAIAQGVDVVQVTQPWRDDALMCKRLTPSTRRHHPSSIETSTFQVLKQAVWTREKDQWLRAEFLKRYSGQWFLQRRNQPHTQTVSGGGLKGLNLDATRKTVVVFSHILWDANMYYGKDLFEDYGHWFVETVKAACANPTVNWLVKLHPANAWKGAREGATLGLEQQLIAESVGDLPSHVHILDAKTPVSTLSLFQEADYGVTVRGTPGMEMPCFGKPVLTAGTGRYSGFGFTVDSLNREDYLTRLSSIQKLNPLNTAAVMLAKIHAYGIFRQRPWVMKSVRSSFFSLPQGTHPLDHNLHFTAKTHQEVEENGDLSSLAEWITQSSEIDYLTSDE